MVNAAVEKVDELKKQIKKTEEKIRVLEIYDKNDKMLLTLKPELEKLREKYDKAVSEKKEISGNYKTFIRQLESDYEVMLRKAKAGFEAYEEELRKLPKREFTDVVSDMSAWAERIIVRERKYKKAEADRNIIQPRIYDRQEGR